MTTISSLAERVLLNPSLDEKLAFWPDTLPPDLPGAPRVVTEPARPLSLRLPPGRRSATAPLDVSTEPGRARVLHELMNHEVQAAELIALALLRWPDAPRPFRLGLASTLRDEVTHARMYLDRLRACGGEPGIAPVSRFFWDTLAPLEAPDQFVAGLSLCFELANLDFSLYWHARFTEVGDEPTAAVLRRVHDDEVRHVAHGRSWFHRWHPGELVPSWQQCLPAPLTPARARGPVFSVESRRKAGFSDMDMMKMRIAPGSRGRLARRWSFEATLEDRLAGSTPSAVARDVTADLAALPAFLAHDEDIVAAPAPPLPLRVAWADAGFSTPAFSTDPTPGVPEEPWGPHPDRPDWDPRWAALSSKVETQLQASAFLDDRNGLTWKLPGSVWKQVGDPGPGPWVIKAAWSSSGTRRIRGEGPLTAEQRTWVERHIARDGAVVWQRFARRLVDVSVHVTLAEDVRMDGITRFFTTPAGAYAGTWLGRWTAGLDSSVARAIHDDSRGPSMVVTLEAAGRAAGQWAQSLGYRGPLSIDAMIVDTEEGPRLVPWLETNARRTLGRVAMALARRISPATPAIWRVEPATPERRRALLSAWATNPVQLHRGQIVGGVLPTSDPDGARRVLTWIDARGATV